MRGGMGNQSFSTFCLTTAEVQGNRTMTFPTNCQLIVPVPDSASANISFKCPFGALGVLVEGEEILSVDYLPHNYREQMTENRPKKNLLVDALDCQFRAYFRDPKSACFDGLRERLCKSMLSLGERFGSGRPLSEERREERAMVRAEVCEIECGETETYGNIANRLGWCGPLDPRDKVGKACRNSPFSILVPCFRVVGKNDSGGFAGNKHIKHGEEQNIKDWLLEYERYHSSR